MVGTDLQENPRDDLLNLIDFAIMSKKEKVITGIQVMNSHCYVPNLAGDEPIIRRSIEIRHQIMEEGMGWRIVPVDGDYFAAQQDKHGYLKDLLKLSPAVGLEEIKERTGGRKVRK